MLISGLWKLAAMASVIGVGLVAVFQAQQGLERPPIVAPVGDDSGELAALAPTGEANPSTSTATSTDDPLKLTNPFAESTDSAPVVVPRRLLNDSVPSSLAVDSASPGLDFRDDSNTEPTLGKQTPTTTARSQSAILPAGHNETSPAPLPDNSDPFAAAEADKPSVVQQADDTASTTSAEPVSTSVDPFENSALPTRNKNLTTPANSLTPDSGTTPDPFNEPPSSATAPARSTSEADPFEVSPFDAAPSSSTSRPAKNQPIATDPQPITSPPPTDATDPFGGAAPPDLAPNEVRPEVPTRESLDSTPVLTSPNPSAPRTRLPSSRSPMPRLPTDVPAANEFLENPRPTELRAIESRPTERFDEESTRKPIEPRSNRRIREAGERPTTNDLIGDGTVTNSAPRGLQQPRLTLEKIAPEQAVLGQELVYQVIVKNVGNSDANHVVLEDRIPKGTELTGTAPKAEMVDKKLIWRIGTMKPNEVRKISIKIIPRQEGPIGSVARVNFATEVAAEIMVAAPQLSLKVNAPREVRVGEVIDLTFLLKNSGGAAANNVSVRDLIPDGLQHEAASDIECPIGKLGPNESREIVLQVTAVKPGRVKNRAILSADGGITQELESTINIIGEHLVLTRTGQNRIYAERPAVFTNSVKNDGNAAVKHVKVAEIVPVGFEFVEASDGGQFDPNTRAIHWTVGPLAAGDELNVTAKLMAKSPGMQLGKITATGSAGSAATVNSEVDVVGRPELQMETLNATGVVAIGDKLTSKIQLKNSGSAPARNVALSISVPKELRLVEVRGARYQEAKNIIRFEPLAELATRETVSFELVMEAIAEADARMDLQITADHLPKPAHRIETVHIATEVR